LAYGDANARGLIQGRKNVEAAEAARIGTE